MKIWLNTKEVAELEGISDRAVRKKIRKYNYRKVPAPGGAQFEIHYNSLTDGAKDLYLAKQNEKAIENISCSDQELTGKKLKTALMRAELIKLYIDFCRNKQNGEIVKTKKNFAQNYNRKVFPIIFEELGPTSYRTLERWREKYIQSGYDYRSLAPGYKPKTSSVTDLEAEILLKLALTPSQPTMTEVAEQARDMFKMRGYTNVKSISTYTRWLKNFKLENQAHWTFMREGEKALNDKHIPYIERDYSQIEVGDIIVADGHVLNFTIVDPWSGKPKRMTLILFYDMKSNMPLGWEIMPTENVMSIAVALRRAIIRLGKYPRVIYLDNGKAFRAKYFNNIEDFRETGIGGLFQRIGSNVIFAWPYHGQSKTIELYFRVFAPLERLMPTYTGTSIEMKPAWMNRGEKIHMKLHERMMRGVTIDITTAHRAIAWYFDRYAQKKQKSGHLAGEKPADVFNAGRGEGVNEIELRFLMMEKTSGKIYRNGIKFAGNFYWNDELFGYGKEDLVYRYDLIDRDVIYVYKPDGSFLCEAFRTDKVHPAAGILGTPDDVKKLNEAINHKQRLKQAVVRDAKDVLEKQIIPDERKRLEEAKIISIDEAAKDGTKKRKTKEEKREDKKRKSFINRLSDPEEEQNNKTNYFFRKAAEE